MKMGFSSSSTVAALVLTVAVLVATAGVAEGQSDCVSQLVTCYNDLNTTVSPSTGCCTAIRSVVQTQLPCLCNLYRNPPALQGINMTQAMSLPTRCNISNDVSACNAVSPTGSTSHPPPGPTGRDGSGASMRSWMGTTTLLLVSALTFLY